ncbi:hypothetical protein EDC04DRAFT_1115529 [Pisolithus marmoratus]|nr:hypothetical protein EDC04DRAFT_1115529 [Pisolithus marmoratus]
MLPHAHQSIAISQRHLDISHKRYPLMDSGGPLSFSLSTPFSSSTSGGTDSSTPGGTSTAASGTETVGATSSTASTSLDTQSEVPSSTPTGGITTTATPPTSTTDRSSESSSLGAITTSETPTVTTTIEISETLYTTASSLTSPAYIPQPSMYTMISTLPGGAGTTTITVTSSGVLSTAGGADAVEVNPCPAFVFYTTYVIPHPARLPLSYWVL